MSPVGRTSRPLRAAVVLVGLIAVWALLAPVAFGGSASYVMVAGARWTPAPDG